MIRIGHMIEPFTMRSINCTGLIPFQTKHSFSSATMEFLRDPVYGSVCIEPKDERAFNSRNVRGADEKSRRPRSK